jgi:hypothetical protein
MIEGARWCVRVAAARRIAAADGPRFASRAAEAVSPSSWEGTS